MRKSVASACFSAALLAHGSCAFAGAGAFLVDDASITPAGHCQVQSWGQAVSGGQQILNTLPACSTGPVEWSFGLTAQNRPYTYQESPAVKWMIRDPEQHALGLAVNVGLTLDSGRVMSRNVYAAFTWHVDKRLAVNMDLGAIDNRGSRDHALYGLGVNYKLKEHVALIVERIQPWNAQAINQVGLRWTFHDADSLDLIAGKSNAPTHNRWITVGLNFGF
jgi:hypothetical protein